jgi:hypothetical protein
MFMTRSRAVAAWHEWFGMAGQSAGPKLVLAAATPMVASKILTRNIADNVDLRTWHLDDQTLSNTTPGRRRLLV